MKPSYLEAHEKGVLQKRVDRALAWMRRCTLCPRMCRVNRMEDEKGFCRTGRRAVVASYGPHYGEESPLVGKNGSGTIFFSHCNLFCVFCQNRDISHGGEGIPAEPGQLAAVMLELQERGCHNINLVTPSHVVGQILEALPLAIEGGLALPLVYNTGGYDRVPALRLLDGIVDIYMPDFKFWGPEVAERMCEARDYPRRAREALKEMHRQTGDLQVDSRGLARRGIILRHLVMPNGLAGSADVFRFVAREVSRRTYVNIMDQYRPCGAAAGRSDIGRSISSEEYLEALQMARREGLDRLDERRRTWVLW